MSVPFMQNASYSRIIIVEDDDDLRESIVQYLSLKGLNATGVSTAIAFYREVSSTPSYILAILDLALPDQDGLVLARYIRTNTSMRIVMLTARTSPEERLAGIEAGADVYMVKPVDFRELAATVRNMLDRIKETPLSSMASAKSNIWRLASNEWTLTPPQGNGLKLTAKEYMFLCCLGKEDTSIVPRETIMAALGYKKNDSGNRSLESLIYRLRKKISSDLETPIKTANGNGYSFAAPFEIM